MRVTLGKRDIRATSTREHFEGVWSCASQISSSPCVSSALTPVSLGLSELDRGPELQVKHSYSPCQCGNTALPQQIPFLISFSPILSLCSTVLCPLWHMPQVSLWSFTPSVYLPITAGILRMERADPVFGTMSKDVSSAWRTTTKK